ncbi:lysophospholipid acyltransferase family protein [Gallionella capsiferriformans]|jgi:1-acyl-sn-glycerol-3-phosphate acyltransferase|uniref:Phospholipid/glycerol acyltransferase n=1 Tax=Gallionella capsiferriformans (strain ES-2) TaxID=395494 RepID=D9SI13_GALCS|nr:lysophospholipid acyltransferase family protein [Gallionella capsiferriformans]ADL56103.1 phospholipid/glycerol acyltransferase [Gallionella capsiferriformans ES-2]
MLFIRSFVFMLLQLLLTPVFSVLAIFTFPFSPLTRYRLISSYAKTMIWLVRVVCGIRHRVLGIEHIPQQPCIVLCKHQSAWETLALQAIFPPQAWVLKRELLWIPFFGWGLAMTSPIAINRSDGKGAVKQLLKQGKARLAQGFFVVIFPEGTRIPYGQRGKYKVGGALLAASAGVPVVPVAHNAGRLWARAAFIKTPGLITMSIGQPIATTGLKADEINARTEAWIENEINTLDH